MKTEIKYSSDFKIKLKKVKEKKKHFSERKIMITIKHRNRYEPFLKKRIVKNSR